MKIDAIQQKELLEAINKIRSFVEFLEPQKSCNSCDYWQNGCALANLAMPPKHIIENGCDKWQLLDIPF